MDPQISRVGSIMPDIVLSREIWALLDLVHIHTAPMSRKQMTSHPERRSPLTYMLGADHPIARWNWKALRVTVFYGTTTSSVDNIFRQ
jgi:hypothetical protein